MVPWKTATMHFRHDAGKVIASFFRKGRTALSSVVLAITGTLGDLHPFLALALRLRADGLSPVVAAMEDYRAVVEAEVNSRAPGRTAWKAMPSASTRRR
jgi:hypothetical protein